MKRGFVIISLFVILIGLCVLEDVYLKQNLVKLYNSSNDLLTVVKNSENVNTTEIKTKIKDLNKFWNTTEGYFCLVVNHISMEEAGEQISKIVTLSELNKKDELIVEINLLIYYAKSYEHIIVPHIQNIL